MADKKETKKPQEKEDPFGKDWEKECDICGQLPTAKSTGLCGPCTWGEADTFGGNW